MSRWWVRIGVLMWVLVTVLAGCSGSDEPAPAGPETPGPVTPEPTPVGTPTGDAVVATIGPEGGSLSSADGVVTVTVPAGAVGAATEFGVQPITNGSPARIGGAYRLTPEGATFAKPVQVSFGYAEADIADTVPGALGIAWQDPDGLWRWQPGPQADMEAGRVSVATEHFSDWSMVYGMQIHAAKDSVELGESVGIEVKNCIYPDEELVLVVDCSSGNTDESLADLVPEVVPTTWAVNGVEGAHPTDGSVTGAKTSATFTAPGAKPKTNPVAVSVKTKKGELLVAHIAVAGGGYKVTMSISVPMSGLTCIYGPSDVTDGASFDLVPAGETQLTTENLVNQPTKYTQPAPPQGTISVDVDPVWEITDVTATHVPSGGKVALALVIGMTRTTGGCTWTLEGNPVVAAPMPTPPEKLAVALTYDPAAPGATLTAMSAPFFEFVVSPM